MSGSDDLSKMAQRKGKRVLKDKTGETLWAEFEAEPEYEHYSDQEDFSSDDEVFEKDSWKDLANGVKAFRPTMKTEEVKAVRWTNEMRNDESHDFETNIPTPSIVVSDLFEICKGNPPDASELLYKEKKDEPTTLIAETDKKLTLRIKAEIYELNPGHYFSACIRKDTTWFSVPSKYVDGEFWFHADNVSSFFIVASSKIACFKVDQEGLKFRPSFDEKVAVEFPKWTVNKSEQMRLRVWPSNEEQLRKHLAQPESYTVNGMSDVLFLDYTATELHQPVTLEIPMRGSEMREGDKLFRFMCEKDSSSYEYERLKTEEITIRNGTCRFKAKVSKGQGNGIVKTRSESVRSHELHEITGQSYLCQFLYYKLPGGTQNTFELWVECARRFDLDRVLRRNDKDGMTEFPHSRSDDIPIHDQENIIVTVHGGVKLRGSKKTSRPTPFHMRFLAMSETTHVKIPLVKNQIIDGAYYAEVDIAFSKTRERKPIKMQVDPWGRVVQLEKAKKAPRRDSMRKSASSSSFTSENECFKEKSLQALALAIPPAKAKRLGRELNIESVLLERMLAENEKDLAEFIMNILLKWKQMTESSYRLESITEALTELDMENIAEVVKYAYQENKVMRSSDFRQ